MKRDVRLEAFYPHPVENVWRARRPARESSSGE